MSFYEFDCVWVLLHVEGHTSTQSVTDFNKKKHQSGISTRKCLKKKHPKKLVIFASNRSTYRKFYNENRANRTFQKVSAVKFLRKKKHVLENGLSNSCTKNQVTPPWLNIEDLTLKKNPWLNMSKRIVQITTKT